MDQMCFRCSRLALRPARGVTYRTFVTSRSLRDEAGDKGIASAGKPIEAAVRKPLIRRVDKQGSEVTIPPKSDSRAATSGASAGAATKPRPLIRRTDMSSSPPRIGGRPGAAPGPILRRTSQPGQVLTRTRPSGQAGDRSGGRPGGNLLRRTGKPQQGAKDGQKIDKRRRRAKREDDELDYDPATLNKQMDDYITKYIDRPENPTEPVLFEPTQAKVEDLRADWPNTPLSTAGITESVIQKIQWIARRLPHGYQSPEQIAERYLKGGLVRFESEEEKQLVITTASNMSAKKQQAIDDGSAKALDKIDPRWRPTEHTAFVSLQNRAYERNYILKTSVKGNYSEVTDHEQAFPFLQNAARMLNNNETYGSRQTRKLLDRVKALIPQNRAPDEAKQA